MVSKLQEQFSVVLKADLPAPEAALLERFSRRMNFSDGTHLLYLDCTHIDTSHNYYLQVESFKPGDEITHPLRVPHHLVLLVSGSDDRSHIGFLAGESR